MSDDAALERAVLAAPDGAGPDPLAPAGPRVGRGSSVGGEWVRERAQGGEPTDLLDEMLKCIEPVLLDVVLRQTNNNWVAARAGPGDDTQAHCPLPNPGRGQRRGGELTSVRVAEFVRIQRLIRRRAGRRWMTGASDRASMHVAVRC